LIQWKTLFGIQFSVVAVVVVVVDVVVVSVVVVVVVVIRDVFCFFVKNVVTVTNRKKKPVLDREHK